MFIGVTNSYLTINHQMNIKYITIQSMIELTEENIDPSHSFRL